MITRIKWKNHNVLGNLELDFTNHLGKPYNTIVLAGENGTGKTTILETLSTFLNLGSIEPFEYIEYIINDELYHVYAQTEQDAKFGFHHRKNLNDNSELHITSNKNNNFNRIANDLKDIRHYGIVYSKARSGFKTNKITSTTTQQLDKDKYDNDGKDDFTSIKQLFVDLDSQDNSQWMKITKEKLGISFEEFEQSSRLFRFKNSFNNFFDKLKFQEVNNNIGNEIEILFNKNDKNISIDNLSTGEKQIVFRGAQLLRNANNIAQGTVLIDEPELSMHPIWQGKVLQYYRNLFLNNGVQSSQLIFATHSEYVLRSAFEDNNNVLVIVLNENDGEINTKKITAPTVLPRVTAAETNYLAFNIVSIDYHIELYGYLQSKEQKHTIKQCDDFIGHHKLFDSSKYEKISTYKTTQYLTLPTYIRNAIDHPDSGNTYTDDELRKSIEFLIEILKCP